MEDHRYEMLERAKAIINGLEERDIKRMVIDLDDRYPDETEVTITLGLEKDYGLDYNN